MLLPSFAMAQHEPIPKPRDALRVTPNLLDYDRAVRSFSWQLERDALEGLPRGRGLNIAHEAVDRHANGARADHVALRCIPKEGAPRDITYRELARQTNRFANLLRKLRVGKGDRVFVLSRRIPELYVASLGTGVEQWELDVLSRARTRK